jgi:Tol biopolymer transport system component
VKDSPTPQEIRSALDKVLMSHALARSERMRRFLQFVVERGISEEKEQLKEYVIGVEVYQKGPQFDPRIDSVVRVEAGRLRNKLREYYQTEGRAEAVQIDLPKGSYVPTFTRLDAPMTGRVGMPRWLPWAAGLAIIAGVVTILVSRRSDIGMSPRIVPLTSFVGYEANPAFSPDGDRIAFTWAGEKGDNVDIWVMPITGGAPVRLTNSPAEDLRPAWSPDGRYIAFLRWAEGDAGFWIVPVSGGAERKVTAACPRRRGLAGPNVAWFPDGETLAIVDKESVDGPAFISRLSVQTGERRRITSPPAGSAGDSNVALSPDGRSLAFTRSGSQFSNDLYVLPASGNGDPKQLTADNEFIAGIAWTSDGADLIFASERGGQAGSSSLWKVSSGGGQPQRIQGIGTKAEYPAVSPRDHLLAYSEFISNVNIWRVDTQGGRPPMKLIASSRENARARYSPDGKRIAFQSNRTGSHEIWVSDGEGRNPIQLTDFKDYAAWSPRWSPDGRSIAFDYRPHGNADVYTIAANGGTVRRITWEPGEDGMPSWSADGGSIFFASKRSGDFQIWKIPSEGGAALQLTRNGGIGPVESPDGKSVYYAKGFDVPGLWRVPVGGGEEQLVLDLLPAGAWKLWCVTQRGIYFGAKREPSGRPICFYDFDRQQVHRVGVITAEPPGNASMDVSPDGRWLMYDQKDQAGSDIILIEKFR